MNNVDLITARQSGRTELARQTLADLDEEAERDATLARWAAVEGHLRAAVLWSRASMWWALAVLLALASVTLLAGSAE